MSTTNPVRTGLIMCAALLVGCSSAAPTENTDQACASAAAFETAVDDFTDTLRPGATAGEIQAARDEVRRTFDDLREEGGDVVEERREALNEAVGEFRTAVDNVTDRATLVEGLATLRTEAAKVDITRDEYVAELGCG